MNVLSRVILPLPPPGDTLLQALDLLPLLIQTVEKAASQGTQVPVVTEGVAAALLLTKLSMADSQAGKSPAVSRRLQTRASSRVPGRRAKCSGFGCISLATYPLGSHGATWHLPGWILSASSRP